VKIGDYDGGSLGTWCGVQTIKSDRVNLLPEVSHVASSVRITGRERPEAEWWIGKRVTVAANSYGCPTDATQVTDVYTSCDGAVRLANGKACYVRDLVLDE